PLGRVSALATRQDVMYVQPNNAGEKPPQNANNNDDVDDGRARMVSDPYFNLGLTGGWIGLLDTGMRFTHTQFNNPSHIGYRRDCVNGGDNCNTGSNLNPNDDCWNHGTSSGAIITANANQGNAYRGVTGITLDSFKVYPTSFTSTGTCNGGLETSAAVRGFQAAVASLDRVLVAEMQGGGDDTSAISTAADNAFDAGAVVIAANGNNGPNAGTVNAPANAHKAIGVGNFDVQTLNQIESQSRGPTRDNRYKPDIQAPTNTETASSASDTALRNFGGTSGATPYAAGAAALLRNFLRGTSFSIDPGQVYALLILSGQQPYPFNNTSGAGKLSLPNNGWASWGKVSVSNGATIDIPLTISGTAPNTFDSALWWPETTSQQHNDVDLSLVDPSGVVRSSSISGPSVFERVRVAGSVASGTWKLRIRGYSVTGSQTVYWASHVRLQ
ncbi:MAG: S8 family serine peptidase, partial [Coleofasciculus sp. Co-bin14]|nr:S8 family serine peptidase [Coleofasciculus sp. Co-bin14]